MGDNDGKQGRPPARRPGHEIIEKGGKQPPKPPPAPVAQEKRPAPPKPKTTERGDK